MSQILVLLAYQVRQCLAEDQVESALLPLDASLQFRRITDEVRHQCGVQFQEDLGLLKS